MFFKRVKKKELQKEIVSLNEKIDNLKEIERSFEEMTIIDLDEKISKLKQESEGLKENLEILKNKKNQLEENLIVEENNLSKIKRESMSIQDDMKFEDVGLYTPRYNFASSLIYKDRLNSIRDRQKKLIKDKKACTFNPNWTVNNSKAKGRKMTNDNIKQILRSFNNECEAAITKVKFSNIDSIKNRITKSYEQLNKLNKMSGISIKPVYLELKFEELHLAYEYELKKQDEKEELREQREREREEKALQREISSKKKVIDKDINHYQKMAKELEARLKNGEELTPSLEKEISELKESIKRKEEEKDALDYRNAHATAGYVYIISNIGAFGEDVVKIGVTRRLDPTERISELSSASVPFKFDTHVLIFSYDAFKLENELHKFFDDYRINKLNSRKEFFRISIDKIEEKLKEYPDLTIDFKESPDAEEYRQSMLIEKNSEKKD